MSLQRTRPIDALQRMMSAFKHFEKKLDKLQEDVNYHGHTLSELRVMVASLSVGTMMTPDINIDSLKRSVNNTAIQYEDRYHLEEPKKPKRKNTIPDFPSKIITKSFQSQKYGVKPIIESPYRISKVPSSPKNSPKHLQGHSLITQHHKMRHRKADNLRKTPLRSQKTLEKKLIKVVNQA